MSKKRSVLFPWLWVLIPGFFFLTVISAQVSGDDIPEWLKRTEYAIELQTDKKPTYYFQMVQPLHQSSDKVNTFFIQPRISARDDRATYSMGFGYRRLVNEDWIMGANIFGDFQSLHRHGRAGVGLEALGQIVEARFNSYFAGLTSKRIIDERNGTQTFQQVVDGLDLEFGVPLPYAPWMKIYGSGFWYDHKKADNRLGWKTRLEAKVSPGVRLEVFTWDDNKGDLEVGGRVRVNIPFHSITDIKDSLKLADTPYPEKDLKEDLLIPVERNFDIQVEQYEDTAGLTVEAARS